MTPDDYFETVIKDRVSKQWLADQLFSITNALDTHGVKAHRDNGGIMSPAERVQYFLYLVEIEKKRKETTCI